MEKNDQILEVIDSIYSAACDPLQWVSVAEKIQSVIGGHSVNLALEDIQNPNFRFIYSNGVTRSDLAYYQENMIGQDNFTKLFESIDHHAVFLTQRIWDEKSLHQQYPYEEFYEPLGYTYFNASLFYCDGEKRGWLSVARSINDTQFSTSEYELMQRLNPHLNRAFLINMHLHESHSCQQMCVEALEHLSAGIIFLSSNGHYVHSNSKAQKYLRSINNMKQNYRVRLPDNSANIELQKAIAETLYSNKVLVGRFIPFKEDGQRHMVICLPWRMNEQSSDWLNNQVGCLLFILGTGRAKARAEKLIAAFDVSPAEARVLMGIINGLTSEKLAEQLCVSATTVRFHIKNLLRRFSAHNQVEMLAKVDRCLNVEIG